MHDELTLAELFAMSDQIGDKYLTQTEIDERNASLSSLDDEE